MHLLSTICKPYFRSRLAAIEWFMEHPLESQEAVLKQLVAAAKTTEWGLKHQFASIKNQQDFAERIPLQNYESLKPFIQRMMQGEEDILWSGKTNWFAKSSGTTNDKSKFIPLSQTGLIESNIHTGKDLLSLYLRNNPQSKFFEGKGIVMGGSLKQLENNSAGFSGDVSAILMKNLVPWIEHFRSPKIEIALMERWEEKLEAMANQTMNENITNLSGVPTWTLLLLKKILEKRKATTIAEVWQDLELYIHGGVSFLPHQKQFDALFGKPVHYVDAYNASEGFFAFTDELGRDDLLLHVNNGIYYEFIAFGENANQDKAIPLSAVELNQNYELVISTNSGLWRYRMGDTIQFTCLNPFRIQITGRTNYFINVFGEELMVDNTNRALALCCEQFQCSVVDYTVAPSLFQETGKGLHQWAIEFETLPTNLSAFEKLLDNTLQQLNSDYEAKRQANLALQPLAIISLRSGTFYQWLASKGKLGAQHKVPKLSNERRYLEEVLAVSAAAVYK